MVAVVGILGGDQLLTEPAVGAYEFSRALTMMEMNGMIRSLGGNRWVIR